MHFMKAIQVFMTEGGEVENGPGSRQDGSQMPSFLDLDLSQQAFRRAQESTVHACPPVLAIQTRLAFYYCLWAI